MVVLVDKITITVLLVHQVLLAMQVVLVVVEMTMLLVVQQQIILDQLNKVSLVVLLQVIQGAVAVVVPVLLVK